MRTILTLKGYRYIAASVSFLEVLVYIVGLGFVMSNSRPYSKYYCLRIWFFNRYHCWYENRRKTGIRVIQL